MGLEFGEQSARHFQRVMDVVVIKCDDALGQDFDVLFVVATEVVTNDKIGFLNPHETIRYVVSDIGGELHGLVVKNTNHPDNGGFQTVSFYISD